MMYAGLIFLAWILLAGIHDIYAHYSGNRLVDKVITPSVKSSAWAIVDKLILYAFWAWVIWEVARLF